LRIRGFESQSLGSLLILIVLIKFKGDEEWKNEERESYKIEEIGRT
jgi:hypothetical protein